MTITAPQALSLLNGKLSLMESRKWAGKLLETYGSDRSALMTAAYRQAFARRPMGGELADADEFFNEQIHRIDAASEPPAESTLPDPMPQGMRAADAATTVDFCHALLNASEFLFVD
jgi:hypothetical protein